MTLVDPDHRTVSDLMTHEPVTVSPQTSLTDAARCMRDGDIGDVLVTDGDTLVGVVTDRDLVVRGMAEHCDPDDTAVGVLHSGDVVTLALDDSVDHAVYLMRSRALRRLPVVDGDRVVGIVSLGDLAIEQDPTSVLADIGLADPDA
ncbi:CBS domain-containing protein [Yinghuangia aomiensis]